LASECIPRITHASNTDRLTGGSDAWSIVAERALTAVAVLNADDDNSPTQYPLAVRWSNNSRRSRSRATLARARRGFVMWEHLHSTRVGKLARANFSFLAP
jgi:uncharacterized protein YgbK (DUF1537 family)